MHNTKEKISKQDEEKVSGGFIEHGWTKNYSRCDKCRKENAYPINGGHLCEDCLKKFLKLTKDLD